MEVPILYSIAHGGLAPETTLWAGEKEIILSVVEGGAIELVISLVPLHPTRIYYISDDPFPNPNPKRMVFVLSIVFVFCEYVLTWDKVYPLSISMATGVVAVLTFWRYCHSHVTPTVTPHIYTCLDYMQLGNCHCQPAS